jgi:hypothetical protein
LKESKPKKLCFVGFFGKKRELRRELGKTGDFFDGKSSAAAVYFVWLLVFRIPKQNKKPSQLTL